MLTTCSRPGPGVQTSTDLGGVSNYLADDQIKKQRTPSAQLLFECCVSMLMLAFNSEHRCVSQGCWHGSAVRMHT